MYIPKFSHKFPSPHNDDGEWRHLTPSAPTSDKTKQPVAVPVSKFALPMPCHPRGQCLPRYVCVIFMRTLLRYVRLMSSEVRLLSVCLSVVCNVVARYPEGWTFQQYCFTNSNSVGTGQVKCKSVWKIGFFQPISCCTLTRISSVAERLRVLPVIEYFAVTQVKWCPSIVIICLISHHFWDIQCQVMAWP